MEVKKLLKLKSIILSGVLITVMILTGCGKSSAIKTNIENNSFDVHNDDTNTGSEANEEVQRFDVEPEFKNWQLETEYDENDAVNITLKDNDSKASSDKVNISENTITISESGVYVIAGKLTDGNIIVDNNEDENIRLILNGADIESSTTSPIYVKNCKNVIITLAEGKENNFKDNENYKSDENADSNEPNAVIFSKDDLIINGTGTLNIYANHNHGIQSKDDLTIISGNVNIESVGDSIVGKDSVVIKEGNINIMSQQHGIKSTNYLQDKGYVYVGETDININAKEDGINSVTCTRINGGDINISAGDDGIHSDIAITVDSGNIVVKESYEGIESQYIVVNNGNIDVVSEDDGFNASSGVKNDEFVQNDMKGEKSEVFSGDKNGEKPEGFPGDKNGEKPEVFSDDKNGEKPEGFPDDKNREKTEEIPEGMQGEIPQDIPGKMHGGMAGGGFDADESCYLVINGGNVKVNAQGDGIDSNGYIEINGGKIYIDGPENKGNGALDYGISCKITGGILVAAGSIGMAEVPTEESTQNSVHVALSTSYEGGTKITIKDEIGKEIIEYIPAKKFQSIVFSTDELEEGKNYIVYADDLEIYTFTVSGIVTNVGMR